MTTNDLAAIRAAAAEQIGVAIPALNAHSHYPKVINSPAAVVVRRETTYAPAFDIAADHTLAVRLFVAYSDLEGSQERLDDLCAPAGAWSIPAAIDGDPTLGGLVDYARVATAEDERVTSYSGIEYLTVDLVLEVG